MTMRPESMSTVLRILRLARLRWAALVVAHAVAAAVAVTGAATTSIALIRLIGVPVAADGPVLAGAATLFTLTVLVLVTPAMIRLPSLVEMASRADRRLGLFDLLGTAVELHGHPRSDAMSLVERATLEEVGRRARGLQPSDVVPVRWPRWAWAAPLLGTAAAGALLLGPPVVDDASAPGLASRPTRAPVSVEAVRRLAEVLAEDADATPDPYLSAVAREFQALADRLDGDGLLDREADAEVDRLLEHLSRATAARDDAVGRLLRDIAETGLREQVDGSGADPAAAVDEEPVASLEPVTTEGGREPDGRDPPRTFAEMLEELDQAVAARAETASFRLDGEGQEILDCDGETLAYTGVCISESEMRRERSGMVQQGEAAGEAVGAAEESDDRPGDAAGDGGQPDGLGSGEALEPIGPEIRRQQVHLPAGAADDDGRHIEVAGAPGGEVAEATAIEGANPVAEHRAEEGAMAQQSSDRVYDQVVRRYFLPAPLDEASVSADPRGR
jgi:hypothetical protein